MKKYRSCVLVLLVGLMSILLSTHEVSAAREMERLGRGVVAISTGNGIFVSWRMLGTDPTDISFNVYRNTTKVNSSPITDSTNFQDSGGSTSDLYTIVPVLNGEEQTASQSVTPWDHFYNRIPLTPREGYEANDASVGDLDGDGEYELVLKRLSTTLTKDATAFHYLEAYEMDGTLIWAIDLGPNELLAPLEINPIVYDFDGDGRSEVVLRTTEGVTDGEGNTIGDTDGDGVTDYRTSAVQNGGWQFMTEGPEFLSVFDGESGREIARSDYIERDPISQWGLPGQNLGQYAHRADKCMITPAYLNGNTPSIVVSRGIYEKIMLEAWSFRNGTLTKEWTFDSDQNPGYAQQGNHNLTVGDVDADGFDEIVYGQMTVDHDGTGLYTTGLGHGDAIHMGEMIPGEGLQIFAVHEHYPYGATLRNAATGEIIWNHTADGDTGRGCAAHIDADNPGYQMWDVSSGGTYDSTTQTKISDNMPNWGNFLLWWTGDLQREILDVVGSDGNPILSKWNSAGNYVDRYLNFYRYPTDWALHSNNSTKGNPCISGDLIGDWREEVIYGTKDGTALYIFSTTEVTSHRIYTLMHDSMYRTAIAWQCNQYNQPPHPSFYIGAGMSEPPTPDIFMPGDTNAPVAPTGLMAVADGAHVTLSWSTNSEPDLSEYRVFRSTTADGPYVSLASHVEENSYTDNTVANGTTYYYVIAATDLSANISAYSTEVSATGGPDLVAYYRMEGATSDSSGNENRATASGSPTYATGHIGQAANLDGNDDFITLPAGILNNDDMTIAAWVYWNGGSSWQRIFDFGNDTTQYLFLTPSSADNTLRFAIVNGGSEQIVETSSPLTSEQWVHLAVRLSGNTATLYINGNSAASSSSVTIDPSDFSPKNNYIGQSQWPDPLFDGKMDEFMVYNYALDNAAIANLAADVDTIPPLPPATLLATSADGGINLDWSNNSDPDFASYTVYRSTSSESNYNAIASGLQTSAYTDSNVNIGSTYHYVVTATDNSSNESPYSTVFSADITPPTSPENLTITATDDSSAHLDWSDNNEADLWAYTVYRSTSSGSDYSLIATTLDTSAYTDTDLIIDTTYYYVVTATDAYSNESGYSAEANVTPKAEIIPQVDAVAYYRFEEGNSGTSVSSSGSSVIDSAGADDNLKTASSSTAPQYSTAVPSGTVSQTGQANTRSTYYDGSDNLYNSIKGPVVSTVYSNITVEAYVRFSSLSGFQTIVGRDDTSGNTSGGVDGNTQALFYLSKHMDGQFRVEASTVGGNLVSVEGNVNPALNQWYHLAAVGDAVAGTLTLYVDGNNVGSTTGFDGLYPTTTHSWTIGRGQYNGNPVDDLNGYIDEVRITSSALSPEQLLCTVNPDTDADGLADAWEMENFGNLTPIGTDDPDGDGLNNEIEETEGSSPLIPSIRPTIEILSTNGTMRLSWPSTGWQLYGRTNLTSGAWEQIENTEQTNAFEIAPEGRPETMFYQLIYPQQ